MADLKADFCIIGAGSGGLSLAAGAAQMGASVILIEKGKMGGDCLNYGCVPSKALLACAKAGPFKAHRFGWQGDLRADFSKVQDHVQRVISTIALHDSVERFTLLGVRVIAGTAHFLDKQTVMVNQQTIQAKKIVIATGSMPFIPPIEGLATLPYLTNETLFDLKELPKSLIIIGAGPIGVEMAQAFQRLGTRVTLLEALTLLAKDDSQAVEIIRDQLQLEGVTVVEKAQVIRVARQDERVHVYARVNNQDKVFEGSHILLAVGRRPRIEGLRLDAAGVRYTHKGIEVDQHLRTSNKRIYAIGDVVGHLQFTHVANYHAGLVLRHAIFKFAPKVRVHAIPWVTYTDPELAQVGLTQMRAQEEHIPHKILHGAWQENDRAQAELETQGLIKVITSPRGQILGATIVGSQAGELILPWVLAIQKGMKIKDMASVIVPYPTLSEVSKRAAASYYIPFLFSEKTRRWVRLLMKWG